MVRHLPTLQKDADRDNLRQSSISSELKGRGVISTKRPADLQNERLRNESGDRQQPDRRSPAQLSSKARERAEHGVNILGGVVCADLKADLFVALRHHWVVKPGGENALLVKMPNKQ